MDAIGFDETFTDSILTAIEKISGLPRSHIRLSCTHTHSGPNTFRLAMIHEGLNMVEDYLEALPGRIAGAVWQSRQSLQPVRLAAAKGSCSINSNRRVALPDGRIGVGVNEASFVDRTVRVVSFYSDSGQTVGSLLHYACHPTTIAWQAQHFTPDYPGVARQVMEHETGGRCLFLQGAAGNLGPRIGFSGDLSLYRRWGRCLGWKGQGWLWNSTHLRCSISCKASRNRERRLRCTLRSQWGCEDHRLSVAYRMMQLPVRSLPSPTDAEAEAQSLRQQAIEVRASGTDAEIRFAHAMATQAGMRADVARRFHGKTTIGWPLQTFCVGPVALIATAGEPFSETGVENRRELSISTHTVLRLYKR